MVCELFEFCRRALENLSRKEETKEEANKYLQCSSLHIQLRRYLEEYGSSFLDLWNRIKMQRMNFYTQTGDENVDIVYHLPSNKKIRLYHSNIYKEKVVSFNISTA